MPNNKILNELIKELKLVKQGLTDHLIESGSVKSDIKWLKWAMSFLCGMGALILGVLLHRG